MMESQNNSTNSPQNRRNENGKRKFQNKGSPKKKAKLVSTTDRDEKTSNVWTEFDELERLCLPNYKFVRATHNEIQPKNYPSHYDVDEYLALRTAVERRQYRNSKDLRKNIPSESDESELTEHRLCHKQLRGQQCKNPICSFRHEFRLPRKLRLCSEWMKGTCSNGDGCLYLHSEFPCRYHYLGMKSPKHDVNTCRFHHGGPLPVEYEEMFLNTIDATKLPMFREMYSKRLVELRGELGATATAYGPSKIKQNEDTISSHESTKKQEQETNRSFPAAQENAPEKSVEDAEKQVNDGDVHQENVSECSAVCKQIDRDSSDDESNLHIVDD